MNSIFCVNNYQKTSSIKNKTSDNKPSIIYNPPNLLLPVSNSARNNKRFPINWDYKDISRFNK